MTARDESDAATRARIAALLCERCWRNREWLHVCSGADCGASPVGGGASAAGHRARAGCGVSAWQVVGPTGHTVAIYDRESTAVRVADQLGYRAFPWTAESAAEPPGVGEPAGDGSGPSVAVSAPFPGELRGLRGGAA